MPRIAAMLPPLAQSAPTQGFRILVWSGLLIGAILLLWILMLVGRSLHRRENEGGGGPPFSLHELRRLHADGRLTDEEFSRMRQHVMAMAGYTLHDPDEDEQAPAEADQTGLNDAETDQPDESESERGPTDEDEQNGDNRPDRPDGSGSG